jgi:DNA-binding MarR family transcriptional regulator
VRQPHPTDRRSQQVFLTEAGRERLAEALPAVQAVEARLAGGFTAEEMTVVTTWLTRMTEAYPAGGEEIPSL